MKELRTSIRYERLLFLLGFSFLIALIIDVGIFYKILIVLFLTLFDLISVKQIIADHSSVFVIYPFNPFKDRDIFNWSNLLKVRVVYRSGITHGAMMPSYIEFMEDSQQRKVMYRLSKEEVQTLETLVISNGIEFECLNSPFREV